MARRMKAPGPPPQADEPQEALFGGRSLRRGATRPPDPPAEPAATAPQSPVGTPDADPAPPTPPDPPAPPPAPRGGAWAQRSTPSTVRPAVAPPEEIPTDPAELLALIRDTARRAERRPCPHACLVNARHHWCDHKEMQVWRSVRPLLVGKDGVL